MAGKMGLCFQECPYIEKKSSNSVYLPVRNICSISNVLSSKANLPEPLLLPQPPPTAQCWSSGEAPVPKGGSTSKMKHKQQPVQLEKGLVGKREKIRAFIRFANYLKISYILLLSEGL